MIITPQQYRSGPDKEQMIMTTKTLPKSLHTLTVLVRVARYYRAINCCTHDVAVQATVAMLGLADSDDAYGLAAKALETLTKDR